MRNPSPALALAFLAACTGEIVGPAPTSEGDRPAGAEGSGPPGAASAASLGRLAPAAAAACSANAAARPAVPALRRLNRWEYDNTVRDLLGDASGPAARFPAEERAGGFDNNAAALTVTPALAAAYFDAGEALAQTAAANLRALVPCDPAAGAVCARTFIARFGRRAFRRPLGADELARLQRVFDTGAQTSFADGVRLVVTAVLQSAPFLYRVDAGSGP